MKSLKFLFVIFLFPLFAGSQQLSGIWVGALTNDSMTIRKDQSFEMALTEYKGKVYGYSYSTFIVSDTFYYIVKRVKGTIEDGICKVVDDEIVSNNFYNKRSKRIKQTTLFRLKPVDSIWYIDGTWKTDATRAYYALTGSIKLKEEKDREKSKLLEHLSDLNLTQTLSFISPAGNNKYPTRENNKKKESTKTKEKKSDNKDETGIAKNDTRQTETKVPVDNFSDQDAKKDIAKIKEKQIDKIPEIKKPGVAVTEQPSKNIKKDVVKAEDKIIEKKPDSVVTKTETKTAKPEFVFSDVKRAEYKLKPPAAMVNERESVPSETIFFKTDSLVLALYDNGEVDGDTVSVILNGDVIIEKQLLKSSAFKKTIYIAPDEGDSILLILYAENLGLYPPNTGLLIIKDGNDIYQVRFKADFDRNAAILLKRKSK